MGALAAILRPADLDIPASFTPALARPTRPSDPLAGIVERFADDLTEDGLKRFGAELVEALRQAKAEDNLRPVQDCIYAYHRSWILFQDPGFIRALLAADEDEDDTVISDDERRAILGISA